MHARPEPRPVAEPTPPFATEGSAALSAPVSAPGRAGFALFCLGSATILLVPLAFRDLLDFGFGAGGRSGGGLFGATAEEITHGHVHGEHGHHH